MIYLFNSHHATRSILRFMILFCVTISYNALVIAESPLDVSLCKSAGLAFASNRDGDFDIYWMPDICTPNDINQVTFNSAGDFSPSRSPDGKRIVFFSNLSGDWDIYVTNIDGKNTVNITNNISNDVYPAWSPDGLQIAFTTNRDRNWEIYLMNTDGSNPRRITTSPEFEGNPTWSPDGSQIAYVRGLDDKRDVWVMNADGSDQHLLIGTDRADYSPAWSPNFTNTDSGEQESIIAFVSNKRDSKLTATDGSYYPHIYTINSNCRVIDTADENDRIKCYEERQPLPIPKAAAIDTQVDPAWLPNGSRLVFGSVPLDNTEIFLVDILVTDGTSFLQLTDNPADDRFPG